LENTVRDLVIFAIMFGSIPFILKRPVIGVMMWTWLSLMNPHRLTYGAAFNFPFAMLIGGVTLVALFVAKPVRPFPRTPVTNILLAMCVWMTITSFFALEPTIVWTEWNRVIRTLLMVLVSMMLLNTEKDIKRFTIVVALSLGIFGLKGGIFVVASGGSYRVWGPEGSYIYENNSMALALVTILPMLWYLHNLAQKKWQKLFMLGMTVFTAISAMGSYSRGAIVGGIVMFAFLWIKAKNKAATAIAVIVMVGLASVVMPPEWFHRMDTIGEYKQDDSAMGRINAWYFAINVATHNPLGGGFSVFSPRQFLTYAPEPLDFHAAHSIYFQVLGEHGIVGLGLFLALMLCAWRTGTRIIKFCGNEQELKWASDLAKMCQVCIIGFATSGAFLSLAYYDLYYDIIIILVVMEKLLMLKKNKGGLGIAYVPDAVLAKTAPAAGPGVRARGFFSRFF
jgi:probable O-glycosylation ligase (exosortase A-associated)